MSVPRVTTVPSSTNSPTVQVMALSQPSSSQWPLG